MADSNTVRTFIRPNQPWFHIPLGEVWEYRDLLWYMVRRDFIASYAQSVLGPLWLLIQPLATTIVFTVIFGALAQIPTDGVPPFLFYMCGTVLWNYVRACLDGTSNSLTRNASMFGKVYFPRLIPPLAVVIHSLGKLGLNFLLFGAIWFYYLLFRSDSIQPNAYVTAVPLMVVYCAVLGLGVGLWFSALTAKYRDLALALPMLSQLWMYLSPIVYPASLVPARYQWLLALNPLAGITELNRYAFLGAGTVAPDILISNVVLTGVIFVSGLFIFNRVQRNFIDFV